MLSINPKTFNVQNHITTINSSGKAQARMLAFNALLKEDKDKTKDASCIWYGYPYGWGLWNQQAHWN